MNDIIGNTYGYLTVTSLYKIGKNNVKFYLCRCKCGKTCIVQGNHLKSGNTKSCGCYKKEFAKKTFSTHGHSRHPLYGVWNMIKQRCYNKNNKSYKDYGAKGVKVCDKWRNSFEDFYNWATNNGYTENLTLDRVDVKGDYEPSNCRWVNQLVQQNNRSNNIYITYNGITLSLSEWSKRLEIRYETLYKRLVIANWSTERALTKGVRCEKNKDN